MHFRNSVLLLGLAVTSSLVSAAPINTPSQDSIPSDKAAAHSKSDTGSSPPDYSETQSDEGDRSHRSRVQAPLSLRERYLKDGDEPAAPPMNLGGRLRPHPPIGTDGLFVEPSIYEVNAAGPDQEPPRLHHPKPEGSRARVEPGSATDSSDDTTGSKQATKDLKRVFTGRQQGAPPPSPKRQSPISDRSSPSSSRDESSQS